MGTRLTLKQPMLDPALKIQTRLIKKGASNQLHLSFSILKIKDLK